jgi:tRNA(Ile)-lysidine synthase
MLNRFKHIVEEMRGLIDDSRSAPSVISSERSESRNLYLLAVSGGVDSMCLADLWVRVFGADSCAIAHCNFNLRGEDSDLDEALVTAWAGEHGVRIHKVSFDTVQYASQNGVSIEMAARELRYRWFGDLCKEHGYCAVAVAHHADDNAETLVLNMVRGAGLKGLTGMKSIAPLPCLSRHCEERSDVAILRPLLTFTRKQIEGHVFAWKVPYREDKTNSSVEYRRNSVRHEVFPLFERMNPSYVRTLNREMTYLKDASDIVEDWCRAQLEKVLRPNCHFERAQRVEKSISIPSLLAIPQWRYLLYYILEPYGFNSAVLESLEALLLSDRTVSGKRFESEEYVLSVERNMLVINKISVQAQPFFTQVPTPGAYHAGGLRLMIEVLPWTSDMSLKQPAGTLVFDAEKLTFPFVLRSWRNGDWMIPFGMRGKKKLSDLFADLKYGSAEKDAAVVVVDCKGDSAELQHVAALLPVRMDDRYKVTGNTKEIIRITLTDNQ